MRRVLVWEKSDLLVTDLLLFFLEGFPMFFDKTEVLIVREDLQN